ncbi:hypothetical protein Tco_0672391 [Tanacetum coccineum]
MNTSTDSSIISGKIANMHLWKVAGALHKPKGIRLKKRGFFQECIFQVIRKRFEFRIRRRFFKRCLDLIISVKGDFFNGSSSVSDSDSEFSSTVIAMNASKSAKSFSSRMVPLMK